MLNPWKSLKIDQAVIAIVSHGPSIMDVSQEDWSYLRERAFVVSINHKLCNPHMMIWLDRPESIVDDVEKKIWVDCIKNKNCLYATRGYALTDDDFELVDYLFDEKGPGIVGLCTIFTAMQLFRRDFPEKKILLFGVDHGHNDNRALNTNCDTFTENDFYRTMLNQLKKDYQDKCNKFLGWGDAFVNCSPVTTVESFRKNPNWKSELVDNFHNTIKLN